MSLSGRASPRATLPKRYAAQRSGTSRGSSCFKTASMSSRVTPGYRSNFRRWWPSPPPSSLRRLFRERRDDHHVRRDPDVRRFGCSERARRGVDRQHGDRIRLLIPDEDEPIRRIDREASWCAASRRLVADRRHPAIRAYAERRYVAVLARNAIGGVETFPRRREGDLGGGARSGKIRWQARRAHELRERSVARLVVVSDDGARQFRYDVSERAARRHGEVAWAVTRSSRHGR